MNVNEIFMAIGKQQLSQLESAAYVQVFFFIYYNVDYKGLKKWPIGVGFLITSLRAEKMIETDLSY